MSKNLSKAEQKVKDLLYPPKTQRSTSVSNAIPIDDTTSQNNKRSIVPLTSEEANIEKIRQQLNLEDGKYPYQHPDDVNPEEDDSGYSGYGVYNAPNGYAANKNRVGKKDKSYVSYGDMFGDVDPQMAKIIADRKAKEEEATRKIMMSAKKN